MHPLRALVACALAALVVSGCYGRNESVSNVKDAFSYGGQVSSKTANESYRWENTEAKAYVSWGGQIAKGQFSLAIKDAAGRQVYSATEAAGNSGLAGTTASGVPGEWTIALTWTDVTGNMGLSVVAYGSGGPGFGVPTGPPTA